MTQKISFSSLSKELQERIKSEISTSKEVISADFLSRLKSSLDKGVQNIVKVTPDFQIKEGKMNDSTMYSVRSGNLADSMNIKGLYKELVIYGEFFASNFNTDTHLHSLNLSWYWTCIHEAHRDQDHNYFPELAEVSIDNLGVVKELKMSK